MKKTATSVAITMAIGGAAVAPQMASAIVLDMSYTGFFTMLDSGGNALSNTSITAKGANTFQTPISGTMSFDTATGGGTGTLVPFDFFSNAPSQPASAVGITFQAIGDGMGGSGTLVLGNMLFNWGGSYGIPVSIVMDAAGFFTGGAFSATPASDGTYTNPTHGYLNLGPNPMVTTSWNVHNAPTCGLAGNSSTPAGGGCMGVAPSGGLPLVADTALNANKSYYTNTYGIGGVPMWDGPFLGFNANFDVTSLTTKGTGSVTSIGPFPVGPYPSNGVVPVPAAVWLFGSGLVGLVGVARRNKKA